MSNEQLFEEFIMQNMNHAYRFAYSYTKNEVTAEDVVGESIVKAFQSIHTLKNQAYLKTWFYRIIINTALSQLKREQRDRKLQSETASTALGETVFLPDGEKLSFQEMLDVLDPKYKSIIILRFFEDMTLEEIARTLGENLNTVKSRLYRALKILRIEMEEEA